MSQRHIIGSCTKVDLKEMLHLVEWMEEGKEIDTSNLTQKNKMACVVLYAFVHEKIPLEIVDHLKEVLIWDTERGTMLEYKPLDYNDQKFRELLRGQRSSPS